MMRGAACNGGGLCVLLRVCVSVAVLLMVASCESRADLIFAGERPHEAPAPPDDCNVVEAGFNLQRAVDDAIENTTLCLEPGDHAGPLDVNKNVTIWGPHEAVIRSSGEGTTIELGADGAALLGVTIDGSGGRFDTLDAAVHVTGDHNRVEGVVVRNAAFGLLVEKANYASIRNNLVLGPDEGPLGLRGDGIRLWETRHSVVEGNDVIGSRDMVVWYSSDNRIVDNTVLRSRYGTHFMYSHGNVLEGNRYIDNVVGVFIMYSRNVQVKRNLLARSSGPGGMGLGIKESGNLAVSDNFFVANTKGVYMDTSPLDEDDFNRFERNAFYHSEVAVLMHGSEHRNTFSDNAFVSNHSQVEVEGGGDALGVDWKENAFDDYAGYDMDRDGYGDIPYELRRLSSQLASTYPQLLFFRGAITLELLDAISLLFPLVEPQTTLIDSRPKMSAATWDGGHAGRR
ncbi:MAG: nitrous oxide reductase family maturation protein NosD [Myxococcales bacterium]|nr:nitrous oxide reductase family maturation protein NosD [Myxococcales bacterium]